MAEQNVDTIDYESMSEEELSNYLDEQEGKLKETKEEVQSDSGEQQNEQEQEQEEQVEENNSLADSANEEQVQEEDNDESVFYKNKKREDLIETIEHGTRKITRQENDIHRLNRELEEIRKNQKATVERQPKEKDVIDELSEQYDSNDISAIDKIVERKLKLIEERRANEKKQFVEQTVQENELSWSSIQTTLDNLDKGMSKKVQDVLINEMKTQGAENTLQVKGWVTDYTARILPTLNKKVQPQSDEKLIKRKVSASTAGSSNKAPDDRSWIGKPEPKDPDDYLKWLKQNHGIVI